MHFEPRLWSFTKGLRLRIGWAVAIGLLAAGFGVMRLGLLGWLIGRIFSGDEIAALTFPIGLMVLIMLLRGIFEYWRAMIAHETAARIQKRLRRAIYDRITTLGPGVVGRQRSGTLISSLIEGVELLETYFGQYLPQFLIALLTPLLIFVGIAFIDPTVAGVLLVFALLALFAPALWHKRDAENSRELQKAFSAFAAEFLDAIQGLATLKAFGQSGARAERLATQARNLSQRTMWVLGGNVLARGISDTAIACGAAAALALGAWRVEAGALELSGLLIVLMLGVEIFRPMRELRSVLHQGMAGMSAAQGIHRIFDEEPQVADAAADVVATPEPSIRFEAVSFGYPGTRRTIHKDLDFTLDRGERVGLVGSSGGGKSSIVRLLLRFYDPAQGRILLGGRDLRELSFHQIRSMISVVNQDAFLFHGTIEENIRMGRPDASPEEVVAAARAANIHYFVVGLPAGYGTVVGEKGIKLSGGQRQRVAIARSLLRDAPILVLDEALSAIDAENEALIQQALDRLMRGRTTLVLAHRLSSIICCDRILVLHGGRVAENGSHAELMRKGGLYTGLMAEQAREAKAGTLLDAGPERVAFDHPALVPHPESSAPCEGILKAQSLSSYRLIGKLMELVIPWKGRLVATFFLGVARVLALIGVGVVSALIVLALKNGEHYGGLIWVLAMVAPLAGILHWLESWVAHDMAFRLLAEMRVAAFRKLDALAPAYLVLRRTGDLTALATHDIEMVEYFFAHTVAPALVAVLVPLLVLGILGAASPWIGLALLPFLLAAALSPFLFRERVNRLGSHAREAAGELSAFAVDAVQGLGEIITFQQEQAFGEKLDDLTDRHIRLRLSFFGELTLQQSSLEVFTGLGGLAVVVAGAFVAHQGAMDAGLLPLLAILAMAAFLPVSEIAQVGRQLADTLGATRRIYALMEEPVPVLDGPGVAQTAGPVTITLETVTFSYPGTARPALDRVSFDIPTGSKVAFVGPSGAGKTTIAQLLMRFWDPQSGRILMNGSDLPQYRLDELRRNIALVAQDTYLFNDTLRNNVLIARPDAGDVALKRAVRQASLGDLLAVLPNGLDSPVGERGMSLSGGQRQRIAIARAFLKNAPVLILDEATSHLDAVNEQAIHTALEQLQASRTTLVIAHRLSTVRDADYIVVLDQGRVVEIGSHEELLDRGGLYARLVSRQLAGSYLAASK